LPDRDGASGLKGSVAAKLEAAGAWKRLAEDQAGPVVEGFEYLGVELVDAAPLTSGLGTASFGQAPSPGSLAKDAIQPAA
jgi:hypothetical protein